MANNNGVIIRFIEVIVKCWIRVCHGNNRHKYLENAEILGNYYSLKYCKSRYYSIIPDRTEVNDLSSPIANSSFSWNFFKFHS